MRCSHYCRLSPGAKRATEVVAKANGFALPRLSAIGVRRDREPTPLRKASKSPSNPSSNSLKDPGSADPRNFFLTGAFGNGCD